MPLDATVLCCTMHWNPKDEQHQSPHTLTMQDDTGKGRSPFYPGQPVPVEFFAGRGDQIARIVRAAGQVRLGKPQALFVVGEYGIGKSSLAAYARRLVEKDYALLGIHVFLGGAKDVADVATKTVEATIKARVYQPTVTDKIRNFLAKYVGQPEVFGVSVDFERLRADGPGLSRGFLPFLRELLERVREDGPAGILLILDEINGISANPEFAHFIKTVVDENATGDDPVPLLLMLCGTEEAPRPNRASSAGGAHIRRRRHSTDDRSRRWSGSTPSRLRQSA